MPKCAKQTKCKTMKAVKKSTRKKCESSQNTVKLKEKKFDIGQHAKM